MTLIVPSTVGPCAPPRYIRQPLSRPRHFADDVAVFGAEFRAELLQAADVQIDRPVADRASAGDRDDRLAALGEQRAEHADAGAHRLDDVVAGLALLLVGDFDVERAVERGPVGDAWSSRLVAIDVATQLADAA